MGTTVLPVPSRHEARSQATRHPMATNTITCTPTPDPPPLHHRKRPPAKETKLNTYTTHAQKRTDNEKSSLKSWSPGVTASVRVGTGAASTTARPSTHARASVKTTAARGGCAARCCGPAIIAGGNFFFFCCGEALRLWKEETTWLRQSRVKVGDVHTLLAAAGRKTKAGTPVWPQHAKEAGKKNTWKQQKDPWQPPISPTCPRCGARTLPPTRQGCPANNFTDVLVARAEVRHRRQIGQQGRPAKG